MKNVIETLLALQALHLKSSPAAPEVQQQIQALRKQVPESLVVRFDRWMARRKKAVAVVHCGVCSECHLQLPVGVLGALVFADAIQYCGNCGRFLYLPENEPVLPARPATKPKASRRRRETAALIDWRHRPPPRHS